MKVGVFGGRFDPVHIGHLIVASDVRERLGLDRVAFMPSWNPPHKPAEAKWEDRLRMLELAIEGVDWAEIWTVERELNLPKSYTVLVLEEVRRRRPGDEIYFFLGTDEFANLPSWHQPERLFHLAKVVVLTRAIKTPFHHQFVERALFVPNRVIEISSSEIRRRVREGRSIRFLVPEPVRAYIEEKGLYAGSW